MQIYAKWCRVQELIRSAPRQAYVLETCRLNLNKSSLSCARASRTEIEMCIFWVNMRVYEMRRKSGGGNDLVWVRNRSFYRNYHLCPLYWSAISLIFTFTLIICLFVNWTYYISFLVTIHHHSIHNLCIKEHVLGCKSGYKSDINQIC